jgi:hypothetical protein
MSKIITLCGSTKFKEQYLEANKSLTLRGHNNSTKQYII